MKVLKAAEKICWGIAIAAILVIIYVNTDSELVPPPILSPVLVLLFGYGLGGGMLFRSLGKKEDNTSRINYFMKLAVSVLVLLFFSFAFLLSLIRMA